MRYRIRLDANGQRSRWGWREAETVESAVLAASKAWYTSGVDVSKPYTYKDVATWNPDGPGKAVIAYDRYTLKAYGFLATVDVLLSVSAKDESYRPPLSGIA